MYSEKLKEIDFSILNIIYLNPEINPTQLGIKSHVSRYTALNHSAKLEKLGYVIREKNGGNVFKIQLAPEIKIKDINEIKYNQDKKMLNDVMNEQLDLSLQAWTYRFSTCPEKPLETLIVLAKLQREVTSKELAKATNENISTSHTSGRLTKLMELAFVQRKSLNGGCRYVYFLNPPLTLQIIQQALDLNIFASPEVVFTNSEDDKVTFDGTPINTDSVAMPLAKEQSSDDVEQAVILLDNNHESLDFDTTEQETNGYNQNGTSDRQPVVSLDPPVKNLPALDTAYDIEDEIELLCTVIETQQSEIESSKAEIASLKQRMAAIEALMGQSNQKQDSDRITQLQAQDKIDRRTQRMQSIKSFTTASISLPSEQMINSNGKG